MCVPGTEEGQQSKAGGRGVRGFTRTAAFAVLVVLLTQLWKTFEAPLARFMLMQLKPVQAPPHCRFGLRRAPERLQQIRPGLALAQSQHGAQTDWVFDRHG